MNVNRAYKTVLRLYPADYKSRFAAEMLNTFEMVAEGRRAQGPKCFAGFVFKELIGLLTGAALERIAKVTTDRSVRGRVLPDLRMMRPPGVPKSVWFADSGAGTTRLRD